MRLRHKHALFDPLTARWRDLFDAKDEVLLNDLTSTYFECDRPVNYLVGTPKGKLNSLESALTKCEWKQARPSVRVKLLAQDDETYILGLDTSHERLVALRWLCHSRLMPPLA